MEYKNLTLEKARIIAGYTQEQLGNILGVHRNTISAWEKDPLSMSVTDAVKYCEAVGVKLSDIFNDFF